MKVLILTNNDIGLYNFRKELIMELINHHDEVVISLPYGTRVDDLQGMGCTYRKTEFERRSLNIFKDFKLLMEYIKLIKKEKPDYILTYTIKPNIYGGIASRICKVRYLATITGLGTTFQKQGLKQIITLLYRIALKRAQNVIFENKANQSVFIDHNIISPAKAVLVNGAGVNTEEFNYAPLVTAKPLRILFIGRIMEEKGINELFEVAERFWNEGKYPVEFDVVGFFEENYKEHIEALHNSGIIHFHGFQKDVMNYIKNAHCIALPSYHEGMSNTLLEAAAMGRPLIASDIPGCREAIIDNESGFLCRVKDKDDLYNKILKYIQLNDDQRNTMGRKSRQHIEQNFDRKTVVGKIISLMSR